MPCCGCALLWLCRLQDGSSECGYWRCDLCFKGFVSSAASNWEVWACGVSDRFWTGKRSGRRSNDLHPPSSPEEDNADTDDEGGGARPAGHQLACQEQQLLLNRCITIKGTLLGAVDAAVWGRMLGGAGEEVGGEEGVEGVMDTHIKF